MPTYTIRVPDGRTIRIASAAPATAVRDAESWASANPPANGARAAPADQPATLASMVKSFGSGVAKGVAGLADSVPNSPEAAGAALDQGSRIAGWSLSKLGAITPQQGDSLVDAVSRFRQGAGLQTESERLASTGVLHQPANGAERFADTAGQFVPNAFAPGALEGGLLRAGGRAAVRVIAPTVGSAGARSAAIGCLP